MPPKKRKRSTRKKEPTKKRPRPTQTTTDGHDLAPTPNQPNNRRLCPGTAESDTAGYSFEKHTAPESLEIEQIATSKDKIEQPALAEHEDMFIPPRGSSVIISGKSGCGKSTLLANLMKDARFYGPGPGREKGWFDKIFLFSPTANGDDVQKSLGIPKEHVFTDLDEAPELLEVILDSQQQKLDEAGGADEVEQYAIIFDDIIGDVQFMNEKAFTRCFYQVRHTNCTTFICTQHFTRVPRVCRLQANFIFFFQGSQSEVEIVVEEFAPPEYTKNEMRALINEANRGRFNFLTINMKLGWDKRFRRNLDEFVNLSRMIDPDEEKKGENKEDKEKTDKKIKYAECGDEKEDHETLVEDSCNHTQQHGGNE
jgi:hypothetical protein